MNDSFDKNGYASNNYKGYNHRQKWEKESILALNKKKMIENGVVSVSERVKSLMSKVEEEDVAPEKPKKKKDK